MAKKPPVLPVPPFETPAQKAARRKHAKAALPLLFEAAERMEKAHQPLVMITGSIGETWAVAEYGMLPTDNAASAFDGWLPGNRPVEVKTRYVQKGGSAIRLSVRKTKLVEMLIAVELTAAKQMRPVWIGPYKSALALASKPTVRGIVSIPWHRLHAAGPGPGVGDGG